MEEIDRFNIRVYGLIIIQQRLMLLKEPYAGEILYKLPGGGIEFGEGIIQGLQRELKEELNLELQSATHFYTQEEFVVSRYHANEQLLTVYYTVEISNLEQMKIIDRNIEEILWIPLQEITPKHVSLPVDRKVLSMLITGLD